MSTAHSYTPRRGILLASAVVGLLLAGPAFADGTRDRAYLDETRQRLSVEGQKTAMQVRMALREAQGLLMKKEQDKAVARLKKALAMLEEDTALPEGRRGRLISMLKDRIRVAQADPAPETTLSDKPLVDARRKEDAERHAAEGRKIQRALETINDLQKNGNNAEARRRARELARDFPDNPTAQVATRNVDILDQLASARTFRREKEHRIKSALDAIDRSDMPMIGEIEFDKEHWRKINRSRFRGKQIQVTAKERAILDALNRPVTVHFQSSKFQDVIEFLSLCADQTIIPDKDSLKDADIDYDTPVSLNVKGLSLRTVLRQVLGGFGLTYVVKDEIIQVVSTERARKMMTVRAYSVADLVRIGGLNELRFGPGAGNFQMMQSVTQLIDMIQGMADPESWKANGGEGTVIFDAASMSLAIRQSAEVHTMLGGMLR
ncbi:MAG TPA: hypothetical protein VG013_23245 [Gemmataceae bacterium]|jgi:hypothetical protein|nr:hypothetical protein [Gemmataceae bacterium]